MVNMAQTVIPKSDQMNADDLISGPRTITITRVVGTGNGDQPVAVHFEGDENKPFKPCKSMRRVMIAAWGPDASQYVGRSMTLYRDPKVKFGGMEVGGIRIGAMSHIDRDMVMALTVTKAKREPYKVQVLKPAAQKPAAEDKAKAGAEALVARVSAVPDLPALEAITSDKTVIGQRQWLRDKRPELAEIVDDAVNAALARVGDGFPAPAPGAQGEG